MTGLISGKSELKNKVPLGGGGVCTSSQQAHCYKIANFNTAYLYVNNRIFPYNFLIHLLLTCQIHLELSLHAITMLFHRPTLSLHKIEIIKYFYSFSEVFWQ